VDVGGGVPPALDPDSNAVCTPRPPRSSGIRREGTGPEPVTALGAAATIERCLATCSGSPTAREDSRSSRRSPPSRSATAGDPRSCWSPRRLLAELHGLVQPRGAAPERLRRVPRPPPPSHVRVPVPREWRAARRLEGDSGACEYPHDREVREAPARACTEGRGTGPGAGRKWAEILRFCPFPVPLRPLPSLGGGRKCHAMNTMGD